MGTTILTMRVRASCPLCLNQLIQRNAGPEEMRIFLTETLVEAAITHERAAEAICPEGHTFMIGTSEPAYALVFERALQRLVAGDLRDAVLDAYTALDMYTPTVAVRARYDADPTLTWDDIPRLRSELRQSSSDANKALGAALAVASVVANRPPPKFESRLAQLRNRAVHAGEYPAPEDTEWAIFEVERMITGIDDMLTSAAPNRDPSFRLAVEIADYPPSKATSQAQSKLIFSSILSDTTSPRETARQRILRYRSGELKRLLF
jgi:hypothetical protein